MNLLKETANATIKDHLTWLSKNGLVCNLEKTEILVMNSAIPIELCVDGVKMKLKESMKVLGIMFDDLMSWDHLVKSVIKKTNRTMHGLKLIRKHLDTSQARKVITAFYFSSLYYGVEVWYHRHLSLHSKQKIRTAHYRGLKLIYGHQP